MPVRRLVTRTLSGVSALAVLLMAAGQPMLLCAGAREASRTAPAHHAAHHESSRSTPAPHHHHVDCCALCASACGGCAPASLTGVAVQIAGTRRVSAQRPVVSALRQLDRFYLQPFAIGPPASLVG